MMFELSRRSYLIALAAFVAPSALYAAKPAGKSAAKTGDPLTVELSTIPLPIIRQGVLSNYVLGTIKIELSDTPSTLLLREQSYLLRDAIVRIGSRSPIPAGPTPDSFDRVAVTRLVLEAIKAVRPEARVKRVTVEGAAFMRK
jgi:hypothetical protein